MREIRVAINGFGRIGRVAFRQLLKYEQVKIVAINDLVSPKCLGYLLNYDSSHGRAEVTASCTPTGGLIVKGHEVQVFSERDPEALPWKKLKVDIVIESTGFFRKRALAAKHLLAGAKKVIISAPAEGDIKTVVFGVNHTSLTADDDIVSGASCTTNCLAPVAYVLDEHFGILAGSMTTVHAATNDQKILDLPHVDYRRGRAAFNNIIPTSTGAAIAVSKVLPHLQGRLNGIALRIPSPIGSIVDLTVRLAKPVTVDEINQVLFHAAQGKLAHTLAYNTEPIVSADIIGNTHGSIFDSTLTQVITTAANEQLVKVFSWYDNEASYVAQMIRTTLHLASFLTVSH